MLEGSDSDDDVGGHPRPSWAGVMAEVAAEEAAELPAAAPLAREQQQPQRQPSFQDLAARALLDQSAMHSKLMALHAGIVAAAPLIPKDAVQFYDGVVRKPDNKQQIKGNCMACGKSVSSTASTRMLEHLVKCPLVPTEITRAFKKLQQVSGNKGEGKRVAENIAFEEAEKFAKKHAAEQAVMKQTGIKASLQGAENAWADKCIAEFFYANAIPFSVADTASGGLYRRMVAAIKATPPGYKPPNYNKIGNRLLDDCYDDMWKTIKDLDPDGSLTYKYGSTYVTDGWDSCDNHSLINSAFITNNDGAPVLEICGHLRGSQVCRVHRSFDDRRHLQLWANQSRDDLH